MLTELNLHSNQLTGTIPASLNGLSRLEKLLIHNNRLSGNDSEPERADEPQDAVAFGQRYEPERRHSHSG